MHTIVLPSGLSGQIKPLDIESCSLLADNPPESKRLELAEALFRSGWVSTDDAGPYTLKKDGTPDWRKVLMGDRQALLLEMRILTWGPNFRVSVPCANERCARGSFTKTINLRDDLRWKELSHADRETFKAGNRFTVTVGPAADAERRGKLRSDADLADAWLAGNAGVVQELEDWGAGELQVTFSLPDGVWARKGQNLTQYQKTRRLMIALSWRIHELRDRNGDVVKDVLSFMRGLHARYLGAMVRAFDEHDCGVDNTITGECPECYEPFEQTVPFEKHFFMPDLEDTRGVPRTRGTVEQRLNPET